MATGPSRPVEDAVAAKPKARANPTKATRAKVATPATPAKVAKPAAKPQAAAVPVAKTETAPGGDTRGRIIAAAQKCLRAEGIAGASARAIARHGDFNQALVFYHFGSVDGLLQAAAREDAEGRASLYADQLTEVSTLAELVAVGRKIHEVETEQGSTVVLTQLLAGSVSSPTLAKAILDGMTPWTSLVEDALKRVVAGTALASVVPLDDLAFAISSLFLGMELMAGLDTDHHRVAGLFDSLDSASVLVDALLRATS
jgi:AcrR family transcriptional regulator